MVKARRCWVMVLLVLGGRLSLAEIKIKGDVFTLEAEEFSNRVLDGVLAPFVAYMVEQDDLSSEYLGQL